MGTHSELKQNFRSTSAKRWTGIENVKLQLSPGPSVTKKQSSGWSQSGDTVPQLCPDTLPLLMFTGSDELFVAVNVRSELAPIGRFPRSVDAGSIVSGAAAAEPAHSRAAATASTAQRRALMANPYQKA